MNPEAIAMRETSLIEVFADPEAAAVVRYRRLTSNRARVLMAELYSTRLFWRVRMRNERTGEVIDEMTRLSPEDWANLRRLWDGPRGAPPC